MTGKKLLDGKLISSTSRSLPEHTPQGDAGLGCSSHWATGANVPSGLWVCHGPLAFHGTEKGRPKMQPPTETNGHSATKQDLLFYRRFYAKCAERIRRARQPPVLLLIVVKTCNAQGAAAIFLIQFTDKMGASVLLMVTEWGSSPALQLSPHLWLHLIQQFIKTRRKVPRVSV